MTENSHINVDFVFTINYCRGLSHYIGLMASVSLMSQKLLYVNFRTMWNASLRRRVEEQIFFFCPDFHLMNTLSI